VPGTRVPCRVITDSADVAATAMGSVLERMPRPAKAAELPVTVFVTPRSADFEGFVVEQGDGEQGGWAGRKGGREGGR